MARCNKLAERRAAQLRREKPAGAVQKLGHDGFGRLAAVDDRGGVNERARRTQYGDPMHVLAQAAMAGIHTQRLLNERVRRRTFANAWVRRGRIKQNVIETVDRAWLVRPPRLEPDIAEPRNAIEQQSPEIIHRDRVAGQNAPRHMQRLPLRVDASVRPCEQVGHRESGAIGQFRQRVAELLEYRDAGIVLVIVGPNLTRELLDEP